MNSCDTCAFGKNCGAGNEVDNRLKAEIAALGSIPFWCHHLKDGTEYDWGNDPLGPLKYPPEQRKVCGGWQVMVAELNQRGYFANKAYLPIRKIVARRAIGLLDRLSKDLNRTKHRAAVRALRKCMQFLAKKDIGPLEIPL